MIKSFNTPAMQYRRAQAGITLIEVSIGLIIAAIIAAAAFIAFQNNSRRQEVRENISVITEIGSELRTKFIRTNRVADLDTAAEAEASLVSANILEPLGGSAVNSYNGEVTVLGDLATGIVTLTWNDVEEDQCVDLTSGILAAGFTTVDIGGTILTPASDIATIDGACGATAGNDLDIVI